MRRFFQDVPEDLWRDYHWQIQNRIKTIHELTRYIKLLPEEEEGIRRTQGLYPMAITPYYLSLIDPHDPQDPIRLQAIPRAIETDPYVQSYGEEDALREEGQIPHMTHRYPDRVLVRVTTFCAVYCRHCMRKRIFSQGERSITKEEIDTIIQYIEAHPSVRDVLLSGGDPLSLSYEKLEYILSRLRRIPHVEIIRIGTRLPVLAPQRFFDEKLLKLLERYSPIWINTHFNHPKEITPYAAEAVENLLRHGIPVNNQTVLLKGVNDDPQVMLELMRSLLRIKVKPQYLFHCDPIKGAIHFRTSLEKGLEIMDFLRGKISGMGIPTYAVDLPGGKGKVPLLPSYLVRKEGNRYTFRSFTGELVEYEIEEL
ncbi:lysine 2,3-aminomutase YodO family protein [Thermocrinis albus DSM 14484]|uniref:Lysine 2,3-aminomutase YodO family protein n=1 Tax=Thermocrinis albus (strain DSM 14484 / JCM 11386 / HI 11/12) TaxID=638303 RepID=D3SPS1_THEAH|nr:KamA family radical SAM protein [Thermocrinis albus]ADC89158.1 lysine 2,3-aminomutase YodO family protein [Thermocrinis albus DSM 14484]